MEMLKFSKTICTSGIPEKRLKMGSFIYNMCQNIKIRDGPKVQFYRLMFYQLTSFILAPPLKLSIFRIILICGGLKKI